MAGSSEAVKGKTADHPRRLWSQTRTIAVLFVAVLFAPAVAHAQISPGKLHAAHAFLEGVENCTRCHDREKKEVAGKCLECHTMIAERIRNHTGLHGREDYRECQLCHVEHHGRDFELIWWKDGQNAFRHDSTGYTLLGAHARITDCRKCHTARNIRNPQPLTDAQKDLGRTYLGLDTACVACHYDEHRGQVAQLCAQCHTLNAWSPAPGFDHRKTKYPLLGKHQQVKCAKCHKAVSEPLNPADTSFLQFAGLNYDHCTACHEDVHKGKFDKNCASCHTVDGWHIVADKKFDHNRTRYPLKGRHAAVKCDKCHQPGQPHTGQKFQTCRDCHKDYHRGEFAKDKAWRDCGVCHTVDGFAPSLFSFAAHDSTDYPLRGAHGAVPCLSCHPNPKTVPPIGKTRFVFASFRCQVCHKDPHDQAITSMPDSLRDAGCELCHGNDSWMTSLFDHARTTFALDGKHQTVTCRGCHHGPDTTSAPTNLIFTGGPKTCFACHKDIHRGQFADTTADPPVRCEHCHTTANWNATKFDHDRDSQYKLKGGHRKVPCVGCHPSTEVEGQPLVRFKPLETTCKACHGGKYTGEELKG